MPSPSISVVVPAYNAGRVLGRALESIEHQDVPPFEVIVVDDGSTDDTASVARSFAGVRLVQQSNKGLSGARNTGATAASGEALFFLDADDELLPTGLASVLEQLPPGAGALVPNFIRQTKDGGSVAWPWLTTTRVLERADVPSLLRRLWLSTNALVMRRVWQQRPFDETLKAAPDLDLWLGLLLGGTKIAVSPHVAVRTWVDRPESISRSVLTMRMERRVVFERLWQRSDLTHKERRLIDYQLIRLAMGEASARAFLVEKGEALDGLEVSGNPVVRRTARVLGLPPVLAALSRVDRALASRRQRIGDL